MTKSYQFDFKAMFYTFPEGAKIIIDGKDTGKITPSLIDNLNPEPHNYELLHEGYSCAVGTFNPVGWRDFTAQINRILLEIKKTKLRNNIVNRAIKRLKYDPLNPLTWKICPDCKVKLSVSPFRYRKHECECRKCGSVFKILKFRNSLDPSKDPESLLLSERLEEITSDL